MNRYRRFSSKDYIVYGLLAIGIVSGFVDHPGPFIIPLLVFGTIFLLYKFPPNRLGSRSFSRSVKRSYNPNNKERVKRRNHFKVIYGNKHHSEEEPPKYH